MQKVKELQAELDRENAELSALSTKEQQLQKQVQEQRGRGVAHVRTASADLKAALYNQSKTLRLLSQGEGVIVLLRTPGWYSSAD
jgi:predicted RNase H-like nuclease (RuvC/YqgF family)